MEVVTVIFILKSKWNTGQTPRLPYQPSFIRKLIFRLVQLTFLLLQKDDKKEETPKCFIGEYSYFSL